MWIPRDLFMMGLGALILIVIVGFYEILFNYSNLKQFEEEQEDKKKVKKKHWIVRGFKNMIRDIKSKLKRKKKQEIKVNKKMTKKDAQKKLRKMFKD